MELESQDITEIVRIFAESELEELSIDFDQTRLYLSKGASKVPQGASGGHELATPPMSAPAPQVAVTGAPGTAAPATEAAATKAPATQVVATPGPATEAPVVEENVYELRAPMLGTFYSRPSPDQEPFVAVGSEVGMGDPVCVIEVMKTYTQVRTDVAGRIVEVCTKDGELVQFGQVIVRIEQA